MGQLISIFAVTLFTLSSIAQTGLGTIPKTDFSPLIDQNILEQELTAEDVAKATQFASAAEDETALVDSVKTVPTGNGEEALAAQKQAAAESADGTRKPANEKDFQLKLHPTGLASAKRYFPPKPPKPPKAKIAKASKKSEKVVKASKKSAKVAKEEKKPKAKKSKGNGRSTASIKKKSKKSTSDKI